jgi:hypothetical protein
MTVDETPRVRVLRVIARLNIGGPTRHVAVLGETLPDLGFDTLLAHGSIGLDEGSLEELVEAKRLRLVRVPGLGRPVHALRDLGAFVDLVRLTFSYRPDIVHTHTAKGGALGRLAAGVYNLTRQRRDRCLVVHTFHGHVFSGYFGPAGSTTIRAVERVLARLTDRIIAISPSQREEIGERFRIAGPAKISVVPLGLDLDPFLALDEASPTLRETLALEPHHLAIGYVGRLVPIKDPAGPVGPGGRRRGARRAPRARGRSADCRVRAVCGLGPRPARALPVVRYRGPQLAQRGYPVGADRSDGGRPRRCGYSGRRGPGHNPRRRDRPADSTIRPPTAR